MLLKKVKRPSCTFSHCLLVTGFKDPGCEAGTRGAPTSKGGF